VATQEEIQQAIYDRRQQVLRLRRDGLSIREIVRELRSSLSVITADMRWLRKQGIDLGELDKTLSIEAKERSDTNPLNDPARVAEQMQTILEMRLQGLQVRDIARTLGLSHQAVSTHLANAFSALNTPKADELRNLELERLDRLLQACEPGISAGDPKLIAAATRISAQRSNLLGLNRPIQVEHTVLTVDVIDREIQRLTGEYERLMGAPPVLDGTVVQTVDVND
jgi:DNA-binding CsgD family transcriptional regulator